MGKAWLKVIIGSLVEVIWVIGMKHSSNGLEIAGTVLAILVSFYFLIKAGEQLPVSTAYTVFVGLGAAGTILADSLFFGEPFQLMKLFFLGTLLFGVAGLKWLTEGKQGQGAAK